jgi:hypothetical protein
VQKVGAVIVEDQHSLAEAVAAIDYKECGKRILVREVQTNRIFNIFLGKFVTILQEGSIVSPLREVKKYFLFFSHVFTWEQKLVD